MTDKTKIILIYVGVAVISVLILGMSFFLTTLRKEKKEQEQVDFVDVGLERMQELATLEEDITLQTETGGEVKVSDFGDDLWLAVQFYAACPMCAERNSASLLRIYNEFKDEEDFKVVCFSVDPVEDTEEKLTGIRDALDLGKDDWFFVKAEQEKLRDYMKNELHFVDITERTDPIEIQSKGRWAHDLGIRVFRGDTMIAAWRPELPLDKLRAAVSRGLNDLKSDS